MGIQKENQNTKGQTANDGTNEWDTKEGFTAKTGTSAPNFINLTNNRVFLSGRIMCEPVFSHEVFGEAFYEISLSVNRLSNMQDIIPITLSERLLADRNIIVGSQIAVKGQFRSYNKLVGERSKLMLTVFVREITDNNFESQSGSPDNPNVIELTGYICKPPVYRTTPFNREICDMLLAVNRAYNKSDYIPAIAWGRNARFAKNMLVGEKVNIIGRIQSREYQKKLEDGLTETRVAFEVSINKVSREALTSQFSDSDTAFIAESSEQIDIMQPDL